MVAVDASRWTEVSPSPFPHEAEGLRHVRGLLPSTPPFRAWSNLEFRDEQGKWHEIDLLVLGRRRLHLVELKYYRGTIGGNDVLWRRDGGRVEDNPLKLARRKAQRLRSRLVDELAALLRSTGSREDARQLVPYVQESVFLHHPEVRVEVPAAARRDLYGLASVSRTSGLPGIATLLLEPATPQQAVPARTDERLAALLQRIGVVRRQREAGTWVIDDQPLAEGEGWQDWPAHHKIASTERARIRFFVSRPGVPPSEQQRVKRLAEHEFRQLRRLSHDGLLQPVDLVETDLGVGLAYPLDQRMERLDLWLAGQQPSLDDQLAIVEQVADTLAYAHRHRVVHRGLTPRAVLVRRTAGGDPVVRVGDWQASGSLPGGGTSLTAGVTNLVDDTAARRLGAALRAADADAAVAEAYRAPEGVYHRDADRVRLDVFALGALTYTVLTGRAPAADREGLRERLRSEGGLDVSADLPQVPRELRALVLDATRGVVADRLADVPSFLERLARVQRLGAAPDEVVDPLEARPGDVVDGRFELQQRLGRGSTAVGLLVHDRNAPDGPDAVRVLKVALDDAAAARIADEAEVLTSLDHPRLVRLVEGPLDVGPRRGLLLENAGPQTLGDALSARTRLSLDLLERWGADVLEALVALERAGVDHRDVKPSNLGVRENRGDRVKHLVLFDFSLARAGAGSLTAGTPPYLDPFLGGTARPVWDSAAERYSAAVVLFEMATGQTPVYGDGSSDPTLVPDEADLDETLFDPAAAGRLVAFFRTALARESRVRHDTAGVMLEAWRSVFTPIDRTVPDEADTLAAGVCADTALSASGLSARALSALEPLGVHTVADLLAVEPMRLNRLAGVADASRREIKDRARQWRERFSSDDVARGRSAPAAGNRPDPFAAATLLGSTLGTGRVAPRRAVVRLVLGSDGEVEPFASVADLAAASSTARGQVGKHLAAALDAWAQDAHCGSLLDDLAVAARGALAAAGGVLPVPDLVEVVRAELPPGTRPDGAPPAERVAAGLLRLALERDEQLTGADGDTPPLARRRRGGRLFLLATDPVLLDAAEALGAAADDVVTSAVEPVLPGARVAAELRRRVPSAPPGTDDQRLLRLAAAVSTRAALSGRQELHARDLPEGAALALTLGGLGAGESVSAQEVRDRVRARFPGLLALPDRPRLDDLVRDAGLALVYDEATKGYRSPVRTVSGTTWSSRTATHVAAAAPSGVSSGYVATRLADSVRARSFLALGVSARDLDRAQRLLVETQGAVAVDVTAVLLDALHREAEAAGLGWNVVTAADAQAPESRPGRGLAALVQRALPAVHEAIRIAADSAGPAVLLTDVEPLARYDHLAELARWTDLTAPRPAAVWLLLPQLAESRGASVDGKPVPLAAPGQYLRLDEEWLGAAVAG